jgi:hypothetical protein
MRRRIARQREVHNAFLHESGRVLDVVACDVKLGVETSLRDI